MKRLLASAQTDELAVANSYEGFYREQHRSLVALAAGLRGSRWDGIFADLE
ncbi:MAG TPA: hypothetical protein VID03_11750 [Acidimicrobiia bacterium]